VAIAAEEENPRHVVGRIPHHAVVVADRTPPHHAVDRNPDRVPHRECLGQVDRDRILEEPQIAPHNPEEVSPMDDPPTVPETKEAMVRLDQTDPEVTTLKARANVAPREVVTTLAPEAKAAILEQVAPTESRRVATVKSLGSTI
jgi:hypothetical protein